MGSAIIRVNIINVVTIGIVAVLAVTLTNYAMQRFGGKRPSGTPATTPTPSA